MTQYITNITLLVPDYDAGIRFYVDALGFDLLEDTRLTETKRWVRVAPDGAQTALLLAEPDGPEQHQADPLSRPPHRMDHRDTGYHVA